MSFVLESSHNGVDLVVTGDWTQAARLAIKSGLADGLVLNHARGFREQPIDFIARLPIRRLHLLARSVTSLSPIYSLSSTLQELSVESDPRATIDLDELPHVTRLAASWFQIRDSIRFAPQIEKLSIAPYTEVNLEPLSSLTVLTELILKECRQLQSLDGVELCPWLQRIEVHLAPKLTDISSIGKFSLPSLRVARFATCKRLKAIDPIAKFPYLNFFELSEAGEIPSASPFVEMVELERLYLYGSTKIGDGNLGPISALPKLKDFRIKSRRDYSPSVAQVQEMISNRE